MSTWRMVRCSNGRGRLWSGLAMWLVVVGGVFWLEPPADRTWDGFALPALAVSIDGAVFGLAVANLASRYVRRRIPLSEDPSGPSRLTRLRFLLTASGLVGLGLFTLVHRLLDAQIDVYGAGVFSYLAVWTVASIRIDGRFRGMVLRPDTEVLPPR